MNGNPPTSLPPTTSARPYSMADVAMRFLSLLPDLGVIAVVAVLANGGKVESTHGLLVLLAVLAGRLNPSAVKIPGMHGAAIVPFFVGVAMAVKRFF